MRQCTIASGTLRALLFAGALLQAGAATGTDTKAKHSPNEAPSVLWNDRGDVTDLDLFYGAGGREHAPNPNAIYTFVKEDKSGTSPKFEVKDERGVEWKVKLGQEPQAETAATRLLWAAGYFVDEDYYLPEIRVEGMRKLERGDNFVSEGGMVHSARLERKNKEIKKVGNWDWYKNPLVGTKEFNGLRVLMSLLNNWDLKSINNSIYLVGGKQQYLVSDPGASFGKTGNSISRSKSDLKGYEESKFIQKETGDEIDFSMHSRPFMLTAINVPNYGARSKMEDVTKHIPRSDAKWLGQVLGRLSERQIQDCFRAAGYTAEEVQGYTREVEKRIAQLKAL